MKTKEQIKKKIRKLERELKATSKYDLEKMALLIGAIEDLKWVLR